MGKPVMRRILDERRILCGERLATFAAGGGVTREGAVNWKAHGCYVATFTAGSLSKLRHCSGDEVVVEDCPVTPRFQLMDNHLDFAAAFVCKPLPPVKLHMFFRDRGDLKLGPYRYEQLTSTSKCWKDLVDRSNQSWELAKAAASRKTTPGGAEAQQMINKRQAEERKDKASKARAQAKVVLAEKKRRRTIALR